MAEIVKQATPEAAAKPKRAKAPKAKKAVKAKGKGKAVRGKMPVKRSINLILIDENKINPFQAVPAILAVLVLAALFSKYMVIDRLTAMNTASGTVTRLQNNLNEARQLLETFGDVEDTYAHYTVQGMTNDELSLVDRNPVLSLVRTLLAEGNATFGPADFRERMVLPDDAVDVLSSIAFDAEAFRTQVTEITNTLRDETTVTTWSISGNVLTVELTGASLEKLNLVARRLETSPIVDSCTISTANKQGKDREQDVTAKLIIYLIQPTEEASKS